MHGMGDTPTLLHPGDRNTSLCNGSTRMGLLSTCTDTVRHICSGRSDALTPALSRSGRQLSEARDVIALFPFNAFAILLDITIIPHLAAVVKGYRRVFLWMGKNLRAIS